MSPALPAPATLAARAGQILSAMEADPEFERLRASCAKYDEDWTSFTGYALLDGWNAATDPATLFPEAVRAMALKAAAYELTGDEHLAELPVAIPVDKMIHALAAQYTVISRMQDRLGVQFVHATDLENIGGWDHGNYTDRAYRAAWGEPNPRYWLGKQETARRKAIAIKRYEPLGIFDGGRRIVPGFALTAESAA
ncbi:hypothetical protein GCM10010211_10600 [Streptomyces albospinus]|uniref:Uncharacterized protein n=1 Tax=Streptomyces albospinus TaxID=285515 RepID=A0ABQ2URV1_9ACTN|nr:hypothetical protein [Streptomyces albospinus]GGU48270.1 hypothetical protein GCM10010211_10600 [Streptomyces albospinus]